MALTAFEIEGQRYERVGTERRTSDNGRWYRVSIWQTECPSCGTVFTQVQRNSTFRPSHMAIRRCRPCRRPGVNVPRKTAPMALASLALPVPWQPPYHDFRQTSEPTSGLMEPCDATQNTLTPPPRKPRKQAKGGFIER